jgi:protease I
MSNGRILIIIGDAAEALDTMYPLYRVQEDDYEAVVAGPEVKVYPLVMHEMFLAKAVE